MLLQEGIGDTIRVSLTPEPGGDRTREVIVAQEILQTMGLRSFTPMVVGVPGLRAHHQHVSSRSSPQQHPGVPARADAGVARAATPASRTMHVAVMGCVVNGPGE